MPHGNNYWGSRKHMTQFMAQKCYYEPFAFTGGTTVYLLQERPSGLDDENDPAQNVDSTVITTADAVRTLKHDIIWVYPHTDVKRMLNHAQCKMTVEVGLNATIDDLSFTVGYFTMATGAFTAIGTETAPTVALAMAGPSSRVVPCLIDDTTPTAIPTTVRPAFRTRIYAHRTAGALNIPVTLWHRRGRCDTCFHMDALKEDV